MRNLMQLDDPIPKKAATRRWQCSRTSRSEPRATAGNLSSYSDNFQTLIRYPIRQSKPEKLGLDRAKPFRVFIRAQAI